MLTLYNNWQYNWMDERPVPRAWAGGGSDLSGSARPRVWNCVPGNDIFTLYNTNKRMCNTSSRYTLVLYCDRIGGRGGACTNPVSI